MVAEVLHAQARLPGLLELLPPETARALLTERLRLHPAGSTIFCAGDEGASVHALVHGRVKVIAQTSTGRAVLLALRGPGELLGEQAALDGGRRSATAVALDDVRAVVLEPAAFRDLLAAHPRAALGLLASTSARLRDADRKRAEFASLSATARVALRLVELGEAYGTPSDDGLLVDLGLTQDDIASWTGASREALGRALTQFRRSGWLRTERRRLVLQDVPALRAFSD